VPASQITGKKLQRQKRQRHKERGRKRETFCQKKIDLRAQNPTLDQKRVVKGKDRLSGARATTHTAKRSTCSSEEVEKGRGEAGSNRHWGIGGSTWKGDFIWIERSYREEEGPIF